MIKSKGETDAQQLVYIGTQPSLSQAHNILSTHYRHQGNMIQLQPDHSFP